MPEPKITAEFTDANGNVISLPVVNPGGWFGKTWLAGSVVDYSVYRVIVEADSASDAIDEFVESDEHGKGPRIDPDDLADYVGDDEEPTCQFTGNGTAYDSESVTIDGDDRKGFRCRYRMEGWEGTFDPTELRDVQYLLGRRSSHEREAKEDPKFDGSRVAAYYYEEYIFANRDIEDDNDPCLVHFDVEDEDAKILPELATAKGTRITFRVKHNGDTYTKFTHVNIPATTD